jgi:hypothetical protein
VLLTRGFAAGLAVALLVPAAPSAQNRSAVRLMDVTRQAGLAFTHNNGAFGRKYLPETLGSGAAFLDYDNDGWQDILLVNGTNWPGQPRATSRTRLYRNNGNGTFDDVTRKVGLDVDLYGMGVAIADYDNDGWQDILMTARRDCQCDKSARTVTRLSMRRTRQPARVQHVGVVVRLRPRRPPGFVCVQLREVVARARRVLQPGRQAQVLLHARSLPRRNVMAVPQPRQWHV